MKGFIMAKKLEAQGKYNFEGVDNFYNFEFIVVESVDDAVAELGEDKVKSLVQRQLKVDSNNTAREKAKIANGHSTRIPMTEEAKAEAKLKRQADKDILTLLKSKGLTLEQLKNM